MSLLSSRFPVLTLFALSVVSPAFTGCGPSTLDGAGSSNRPEGAGPSNQAEGAERMSRREATEVAGSESEDWRVRCSLRWGGMAVGWGESYHCEVTETFVGEPPTEDFHFLLQVNAFSEQPWPQTERADGSRVPDYVFMDLGFRRDDRPYGPPSGFRHGDDYWVLTSASFHEGDTCPNPGGHFCTPGHWRLPPLAEPETTE